MSSEWEVVISLKKPRKAADNKSEGAGVPKIADTKDMDDVRSLYAAVEEAVLTSIEEKKETKNSRTGNGKQQSSEKGEQGKRPATPVRGHQQQQGKSKQKEQDKAIKVSATKSKHKDLDAAFRAIAPNDLRVQLWSVNTNFKDNHLMALKVLTAFLNEHLRVDVNDPLFSDKPIDYPYAVLPGELKEIIDESLEKAGEQNVQYFYDLSLSNLASNMNKNLPYLGHIVLLQAMALAFPQVCVSNLARNVILRNSYQNRSNIGLSLLWSLGQGGFSDLSVGLKVWQDVMVPVIDLKTYSRYVHEYVHRVLCKHKTAKLSIDSSDFLTILSSLSTQPKGNRGETVRPLDDAAQLLVELYVCGAAKTSATFATLFKNIQFIAKPELIYYGLMLCLNDDPDCWATWRGLYRRHVQQSADVINYIDKCSTVLSNKLVSDSLFHKFLDDIQDINEDLSNAKKKVEGLKSSTAFLKVSKELAAAIIGDP